MDELNQDYYDPNGKMFFPVKHCYACTRTITKYMSIYYAQDKCFCTITCRRMLFIK